jgi:hypothetical protein
VRALLYLAAAVVGFLVGALVGYHQSELDCWRSGGTWEGRLGYESICWLEPGEK